MPSAWLSGRIPAGSSGCNLSWVSALIHQAWSDSGQVAIVLDANATCGWSRWGDRRSGASGRRYRMSCLRAAG
jgi:hypothetical protein